MTLNAFQATCLPGFQTLGSPLDGPTLDLPDYSLLI